MKQALLDRYYHHNEKRHWLRIMESSAEDIPQRVAEIDPALYVVYNSKTGSYEVHDSAVLPSLSQVLEADTVDARIIERLHRAARHNDPFKEAEEWSKKVREEADQKMAEAAHETASNLYDLAQEKVSIVKEG